MVALVLDKDNRVISLMEADIAPEEYPRVEDNMIPKGFLDHHKYINGEFIHEPLGDIILPPSQVDKVEAQVVYTAMMTDTLLEV